MGDNTTDQIDPIPRPLNNSTTPLLNNSTKGWPRFFRFWLPVLCWMALIFFLSSLPGSHLSDFGSIDFFVKKTAHITEYAVLYYLLFRTFCSVMVPRKALIISAVIAVLYAISDEFHQTFIPLREGRARDVFIDFIGICIVYLYLRRRYPH